MPTIQRRYNLKPTPDDHPLNQRPWYHEIREALRHQRELKVGASEPTTLPLIDWTSGEPPIRDQGQEGSCAGHQIRNVRRLAHWRATGEVTPYDFSPAYPYWGGRSIEGTTSEDSGMSIGDGLMWTEKSGICEDSFMPYAVGGYAIAPTDAANTNALTHRAELQAVPVDYSSFGNLWDVMADGHCLIGGFQVPPSFENCGADGALPDPSGEDNLGGHAFSICSINVKDGWMCDPNSWGTSWGKLGFSFMPASYLGRIFELWAIVPVL